MICVLCYDELYPDRKLLELTYLSRPKNIGYGAVSFGE